MDLEENRVASLKIALKYYAIFEILRVRYETIL